MGTPIQSKTSPIAGGFSHQAGVAALHFALGQAHEQLDVRGPRYPLGVFRQRHGDQNADNKYDGRLHVCLSVLLTRLESNLETRIKRMRYVIVVTARRHVAVIVIAVSQQQPHLLG